MEPMKVDSEKFHKQAAEAGRSHFMFMAIIHAYQLSHPDKVHVFMDEVTIHDPEHFKAWQNMKRQKGELT